MNGSTKSEKLPVIVSALPDACAGDPRVYQFKVRDNFCYLAVCPHTGEGIVIDPGYPDFLARVRDEGAAVKVVANTHSHADHCGANAFFARAFQAPVAAFGHGDMPLRDRQTIIIGRLEVQVIHTPGHTGDSVVFRIGSHLFTGDTLFIGTFGYSSGAEAPRDMYRTLYERIPSLDGGLVTWPGHDYCVEDMELVVKISSSPRALAALTAYRSIRNSFRSGPVFSSVADELHWNLAYMKDSVKMHKFLDSMGIDIGIDDFGRYRAIQELVNGS